MTQGIHDVEHRRAFLAHCLGLMTVPVLLTGCRRDDRAPLPPPTEPDGAVALPGAPLPLREPMIRVRVHRVRDRDSELRLGRPGQRLVATHLAYGGEGLLLAAPVIVRGGPRGWVLEEADGRRTLAEGEAAVALADVSEGTVRLLPRDRDYPGALHLVWRSDEGSGAFDVINHVPLERYLPGVLASELFSHWDPAAFRAQAIAARSFACSEHAYFSRRRHFDMSDTVASQVYAGAVDLARALDAARTTRGIVLEHEGRLVPGYYSSCCGGIAARAEDVIGPSLVNRIAPLAGRPTPDVCTGAPVYEWTIERDRRGVLDRLHAFGASRGDAALESLDDVSSIEIATRNDYGRPTMYRIAAPGSEPIELGAETMMRALNSSGDANLAPDERLMSSFVEVSVEDGKVSFAGRGFGHGAGLCQYGAESLARDGQSHEDILAWYYPGARLHESYH